MGSPLPFSCFSVHQSPPERKVSSRDSARAGGTPRGGDVSVRFGGRPADLPAYLGEKRDTFQVFKQVTSCVTLPRAREGNRISEDANEGHLALGKSPCNNPELQNDPHKPKQKVQHCAQQPSSICLGLTDCCKILEQFAIDLAFQRVCRPSNLLIMPPRWTSLDHPELLGIVPIPRHLPPSVLTSPTPALRTAQ